MRFTVLAKANDNAPEYYEADDIYGVIDQLLTEWVDNDVDLPGVFAFLKAEGYDFGILDEDVNEGTDEELLESASNVVRTLLYIGIDDSEIGDAAAALEKLAVFLTAIGDECQIIQGGEEKDEGEGEDEDKDEDEDYDY
jgi:hypothetical protein